jgi:hypothetical protein
VRGRKARIVRLLACRGPFVVTDLIAVVAFFSSATRMAGMCSGSHG